MRRRILKSSAEAAGADAALVEEDAAPDDAENQGADDELWEGRWGKPEEERVARWLQAKIRPELEIVEEPEEAAGRSRGDLDAMHLEETRRTLAAGTRFEADVSQLDQQRRRLAAAVDAERAQAEEARRQQLDAWARLELEMSELDRKRRRLAEAVEAERSEVERVRQEQHEARARLEAAVAELDDHRTRLLAVQSERSEAERARQEHAEARAALAAEVAAIDEQRQRLTAAVASERADAERVRRAHAEARSRLDSEMAELDEQRRRVNAAVEAERAEAERVRNEQLEAKARLEAEIADLDRQRQRLVAAVEAEADVRHSAARAAGRDDAEPDDDARVAQQARRKRPGSAGPAGRPGGRPPTGNIVTLMPSPAPAEPPPADASPEAQEEARARLAAAVADLARHVASVQSSQRIDTDRIRQRQLETRARQEAEEAAAAEQRRRAAEASEATRVTVGRKRRWLRRGLIALVLLIPVGAELGSPLVARSRLGRTADDAAANAAAVLSGPQAAENALRVAQAFADVEGVVLDSVDVEGRTVRVTLADDADSAVLGRWGPLRGWYDVEATGAATATDATR